MTPGDTILFTVVALLGLNHLVTRIPEWVIRPYLFWPLQLLNLGAATFMMASGIPEFQGWGEVVNWILGLLFIVHILQNNKRLVKAKLAGNRIPTEEASAKRARIVAALHAGESEKEEAAAEATADSAQES
jgi:hypothetical protein